jgi:hypothetical protein
LRSDRTGTIGAKSAHVIRNRTDASTERSLYYVLVVPNVRFGTAAAAPFRPSSTHRSADRDREHGEQRGSGRQHGPRRVHWHLNQRRPVALGPSVVSLAW